MSYKNRPPALSGNVNTWAERLNDWLVKNQDKLSYYLAGQSAAEDGILMWDRDNSQVVVSSGGNWVALTGGGGGGTITNYLRDDADDSTNFRLTMGGLTVDTDTLYVDSVNNEVGIGTTNPSEKLEVVGNVEATEFIGDLRGAVVFKALAGEALTKGDVVYISGISGNTTVVSKADADDAAKMQGFGLAATDANSNANLEVYTFGTLHGLDTSAYALGAELYVSTTAGQLTDTPPTGESSALQKIAKVTRAHATSGSVKIMGAGRTNATPNLNDGNIFIGDSNNQAVTASLATQVSTLETSHDDVLVDGDFTSAGLMKRDATSGSYSIVTDNSSNWNTAHGWGNHASAGYLTAETNDLSTTVTWANVPDANITETSVTQHQAALSITESQISDLGTYLTASDITGKADLSGAAFTGDVSVTGTVTTTEGFAMGNDDQISSTGGMYIDIDSDNDSTAAALNLTRDGKTKTTASFEENGDISFYNYTGASPKFRWDASVQRLGIGTTSPSHNLHIESSSTTQIKVNNTTNNAEVRLGSSSTNGDGFVGTASADSLSIITDNATRMTVDSSGNVGIGETNPQQKLDVNGNIRVQGTSPKIEFVDTDSNPDFTLIGGNGSVQFYDETNTTSRLLVNSSGKVGIGTTGPAQELHIASTGEADIRLQGSNSANYLDIFHNASDFGLWGTGTQQLKLATNGTERLRIDSSGNVGIGATSPSTKLHTVGANTNATNLATSATNAKVRFQSNIASSLSSYQGYTGNSWYTQVADGNGIASYDLSLNPYGGNVGIGTDNPATELDVDGTITANGISLGDSESIAVGADDDFTIAHDGTDTTIQNDTGELIINVNDSAGGLEIQHEGVRAVHITDDNAVFYMGSGSLPALNITSYSGIQCYSNITMNSNTTVDGRDVSVDGAKLDKITEKTIRTRFQKRGYTNTVGFLTLTNNLQVVGNYFQLSAGVSTAVEHILDLNISANFLDIDDTNDGEFIVTVTAPAPANETTVNLGTVISTSSSGATTQFVLSGDLTKHFSPYCGMSVNSDGSSAFGFNNYDGWSYDPFYNRTTVECYSYQSNKPTTGDTVYLHPFDWETSGTVLNGDTYPIEAYNASGTTNQNQFHQIYLGYYKDDKPFYIKAREVTTSENIQISRISGTYSNIIGI